MGLLAWFGVLALSALLGGVYLGLPIYELCYRRKIRASQSWPQVTGTISSTETDGSAGSFGSRIRARVTYQYKVDGVAYVSTRIGFNENLYASKKEAQAALDRYPVNSAVTVYFDPADPTSAVLKRDYRRAMPAIVFLYVCLALIVMLVVVIQHFDPSGPKRTVRNPIPDQPWTPPPRVREPPGDNGTREAR